MQSKFLVCPADSPFMGEFDDETCAFHWIMRSGMTHISMAIPFASKSSFLETIDNFRVSQQDVENAKDVFAEVKKAGWDYCLFMALDRIENIAKTDMPLKSDLEHEKKCEMYVYFKFLPELLRKEINDYHGDC